MFGKRSTIAATFLRGLFQMSITRKSSKPKDVRSEFTSNVIGSENILTFYKQCHPKRIKTE